MIGSSYEHRLLPYLLMAPQLTLVLLFFVWPSSEALGWSLRLVQPFGESGPFVGLDNFVELFADPVFRRVLLTTTMFTVATTSLSVGLALALAVAVEHHSSRVRGLEAWMLWPYAIAAPLAGLVIQLVLDPNVGFLAGLNRLAPGAWAPHEEPADALVMVILAFVWLHAPFNFVFLLAGLRSQPTAVLEAAAIDGAGPFRRLLDVRLPMLRAFLAFVLLLDVTESFTQSFGIIHATTRGGPGGATNVLVYNIYSDGFVAMDISRAAAQSVLLVATVAVVAAAQLRLAKGRT